MSRVPFPAPPHRRLRPDELGRPVATSRAEAMPAAPQAVRPGPRGRPGAAAAPRAGRGGRGTAVGRVRAMGAEAPPLGTVVVLLGAPAGLAAYWWGVRAPRLPPSPSVRGGPWPTRRRADARTAPSPQVLVPSERRSLSLEKRKVSTCGPTPRAAAE